MLLHTSVKGTDHQTRVRSGRRQRRTLLTGAAAAAVALILGACGSGGSSSAPSASTSSPASRPPSASSSSAMPTVAVAMVTLSTLDADIFVAQNLGYFTKAGVKVTLTNFGATGTTAVVAGKADVVTNGVSSALSPINSGKGAQMVYAQQNGFTGGGLYVAYNSPYKSVLDLSGKSIVALGAGTASYGGGEAWSSYIVAHGGKAVNVIPAASASVKDGLLLTGRAAAMVGSADDGVMPLVDQKKIRFLVGSQTALSQTVFGPIDGSAASTSVGIWGMTSWISAHQDALSRFLAGVREGDIWLQHHSVSAAAAEIAQFPQFKASGQTVEDVVQEWQQDQPFSGRTLGMVSSQAWAATLKLFGNFSLPFSLNSSKFSYASVVDMGPLTSAVQLDQKLFG